jgi:hypothetical protein
LGGPLFKKCCTPDAEILEGEIPHMTHQTLKLKRPAQVSIETLEEVPGGAYIVQFDGGTIKKLGVGGYLIWDPEGHLLVAQALWFGEDRTTNNECESESLLNALQWL